MTCVRIYLLSCAYFILSLGTIAAGRDPDTIALCASLEEIAVRYINQHRQQIDLQEVDSWVLIDEVIIIRFKDGSIGIWNVTHRDRIV